MSGMEDRWGSYDGEGDDWSDDKIMCYASSEREAHDVSIYLLYKEEELTAMPADNALVSESQT